MENAAMKTVPHVLRLLGENKKGRVAIVCGPGNNGGDGFALARLLYVEGARAEIISVGERAEADMTANEAIANLQMIRKLKIPIRSGNEGEKILCDSDVTVDALFGTGLSKEVCGAYAEAIHKMNSLSKVILSIDVPSGVCADTGKIMGAAVNARETITYGFFKPGLLLYPGAERAGRVTVENISVPHEFETFGHKFITICERNINNLLPKRPLVSNKGTFGRVRVIAGSREMPGAAALCCAAAYRAGAGLVEACVVPEVAEVIHRILPEAVTKIFDAYDEDACKKIFGTQKPEAVLIGPGLGQSDDIKKFIKIILGSVGETPVVLDADGLNNIAEDLAALKKINAVITPHPGEMSRLIKKTVDEILNDPVSVAAGFAKRHGVIVLLKGARTVVASPDGSVYINASGSPALAKAGSGDALAGIIASFIAQGTNLFEAAALGAYLHGKAGEFASETLSDYGVNASDVINALPRVIKRYGEAKFL